MPKIFVFRYTLLFFSWLLPPCSDAAQNDGVPAQQLWCEAKNNAEDAALRRRWTGPCYDPSNVQNTASFAFYDYFLKYGLSEDSCYFDNAAAITSLNPSHDNCKFPSSLTGSNGSFSGSTSSSLGKGPSEDISGCSKVAWRSWFWPLITSHLLIMISQIDSGQ